MMSGKQVFYIFIATLVTVLIWVIADIMHSRSQIEIPAEVQTLIEPISPNFDTETINSLW